MSFRRSSVFLTTFAISFVLHGASVASGIEYDRDIRPLFSGACFACHGPDAHARKAKLRLDTREGALRERRGR